MTCLFLMLLAHCDDLGFLFSSLKTLLKLVYNIMMFLYIYITVLKSYSLYHYTGLPPSPCLLSSLTSFLIPHEEFLCCHVICIESSYKNPHGTEHCLSPPLPCSSFLSPLSPFLSALMTIYHPSPF